MFPSEATKIMTENDSLFVLAAACAMFMGFAIQRGATCTVAAVDEIVTHQTAQRLSAMVEASLWVLGCLLLGNLFGLTMLMPQGYGTGVVTVVGGALLGVGAAINRACVFGAVARLGSGDWAYLATPAGFFLGCLAVQSFGRQLPSASVASGSVIFLAPGSITALLSLWIAWRAVLLFRRPRTVGESPDKPMQALIARATSLVWTPRAATITIGLTFFVLLLAVGPWAYTDVLAELAQMPSHNAAAGLAQRLVLLLALLAGAAIGGWTAGRFGHQRIKATNVLRCLIGGALMGVGGSLIPGGNDGLLLIGLPLLLPYALVALATMSLSIAVWLIVERTRGPFQCHDPKNAWAWSKLNTK